MSASSLTPQGLLAVWQSSPETDTLEIRVEAKNSLGNTFVGGALVCPDATTRSSIVVRLDQKAPEVTLKITAHSDYSGATRKPAANCGTYRVGDILYGEYDVSDEHFSNLTLTVEPVAAANGATVSPSSRSYPTVSTNGETGEWSLNTKEWMPAVSLSDGKPRIAQLLVAAAGILMLLRSVSVWLNRKQVPGNRNIGKSHGAKLQHKLDLASPTSNLNY